MDTQTTTIAAPAVFAAMVNAQATATAEKPVNTAKSAAPKAKPKAKAKVVAKPAKLAIVHGIHDGSRPGAGKMLHAFTHAWLSLSGLANGKAYPRSQAQQVAGSTAVSYHLGNENLKLDKAGQLTLTPKGQAFFGARSNNAEHVAGFVSILKTGKPCETVGIKNPTCIKAIKA